jgi:hypothetical protein
MHDDTRTTRFPKAPVAALVAGVALARLAYLVWWCPYTLGEDEAHYWEWSRRPELSYYSKGPGIAWAIGAGTRLLGQTEAGVRLNAVAFGALGALLAALLTWRLAQDRRAALLGAAMWTLAPATQAVSLLSTIDGPLLAAWMLGALGAWEALVRKRPAGWVVLGVALGAGVLFKYTILLLLPALALMAWATRAGSDAPAPERAGTARLAGALLLGALLLAGGLLPIAAWNARNDWATLRHLLGHLGAPGGDMPDAPWRYNPLWTLAYLGTQAAIMGLVPWLAGMRLAESWRRRAAETRRWRLDLAMLAPSLLVFAVYLLVSLATQPEGNWALAAHATLVPLAAAHAGQALRERWFCARWMWYWTLILGVVLALGSARLDLAARLPLVGRWIPVHRVTGSDRFAAHAHRLLGDLRSAGQGEPFVIVSHYGRASQLAFYLPGRPTVYCASSILGGRRTQYDHWAETDLRRVRGLEGRPALAIGASRQAWLTLFREVEAVGALEGDPKGKRPAFVCRGYLGVGGGAARRE